MHINVVHVNTVLKCFNYSLFLLRLQIQGKCAQAHVTVITQRQQLTTQRQGRGGREWALPDPVKCSPQTFTSADPLLVSEKVCPECP